jgi:hypothetical protein
MHRLILTSATVLLANLVLASPAWAQWVWPLRGEVITPYSNGDDPYAGGRHRGIDIAGDVGRPVVAATGGTVRFAGTVGSSGLTVSVRSLDGFDTSYLHLSSASVREGQSVATGDRLGAVGTSGTRSAERPHLHFGVREAGTRHAYRDPLSLLPPLGAPGQSPVGAPLPQPAPTSPAPSPLPVPAPLGITGGDRAPAAGQSRRRRVPEARGAPAARHAPAARRAHRHAPAARRAPVGRPVPARERPAVAHSAPAAVSAPEPVTARPPAHETSKEGARGPASEADRAPRSVSRAGPAAPRLSAPPAGGVSKDPPTARAPQPGAVDRGPSGPDLGLVLACLGLVGAAALLGLSEDGRAATRRTGQRAAGLLRPLLGRR